MKNGLVATHFKEFVLTPDFITIEFWTFILEYSMFQTLISGPS